MKSKSNIVHTVKAKMQVLDLTKEGSFISFQVYANKEKLGTLSIGRGSIKWTGRSRKKGRNISWTNFADLMNSK